MGYYFLGIVEFNKEKRADIIKYVTDIQSNDNGTHTFLCESDGRCVCINTAKEANALCKEYRKFQRPKSGADMAVLHEHNNAMYWYNWA